MEYQQKMRERIARAEELQEKIDTWERETEKQIREEYASDLAAYEPGTPRRQRELFLMELTLKSNRLFQSRVKSRDSNRQWAKMYALAAIAEATESSPSALFRTMGQ